MHICLYQPQVPPNTGSIGRLCVGLGAELQVIGPCAFDFSDKALRRAGLDYWPHLRWSLHACPEAFLEWLGTRDPWLVSKHGRLRYDRAPYHRDDAIILGNEVRGLPPAWLERWAERTVSIPMRREIRSYNLAGAASVVGTQAALTAGVFG